MWHSQHGKYVVSWDGDFHFGVSIPSSSTDSRLPEIMEIPASVVGAGFLSGKNHVPVFYIHKSGEIHMYMVMGPMTRSVPYHKINNLKPTDDIVLCGSGVENPKLVSDFCKTVPNARVTVCPLLGHLAAFGVVAGTTMVQMVERPRMCLFYSPNDISLIGPSNSFDKKLDGDGFGKMAHLVQSYTPIVNQMMSTPCHSVFYNRVLSYKRWWEQPVFLMRSQIAEKYFPNEPISLRNFAACWVPVAVENTDAFATASGYGANQVNIFVGTSHIPGLLSFLNFAMLMGGVEWVVSTHLHDFPKPKEIPVFRYNKAYQISVENYEAVISED